MATNEILQFASTDTGTNLLTQAQYNSSTERTNGNSGRANSLLVNKALRQLSLMSAGLAEFLAQNQANNITDALTPSVIADYLETVISTVGSSGNAATATKLQTARNINGVAFDGTADIIVNAQTPSTLTRGGYLTGSNFNGSTATTWAVDATSTNTAGKVVVRDGSGNFSAGTITADLNGNASSASTASTVSGIVGISHGGTGADTSPQARINLDVHYSYSANQNGFYHFPPREIKMCWGLTPVVPEDSWADFSFASAFGTQVFSIVGSGASANIVPGAGQTAANFTNVTTTGFRINNDGPPMSYYYLAVGY